MQALRWMVVFGLVTGCASSMPSLSAPPTPAVECRLGVAADCAAATEAAALLLREEPGVPTRLVVLDGRGPTFHAEVHACFADGRYVLVDVIGTGRPQTSIRSERWSDPPCG